jgi:hypothetical protein
MWSALMALVMVLGGAPDARDKAACELGAQQIAAMGQGGPVLLSDHTPFSLQPLPGDAPAELRDAWAKRGPVNLFTACPKLRETLPANVTIATEEDWADMRRPYRDPPKRLNIRIRELSAPMVSTDGLTAVQTTSDFCYGLCGYGGMSLWRREGATWVHVKSAMMWIS